MFHFRFLFWLLSFFCFHFFGLACVVVFSYPVRRNFTCLTLEFAFVLSSFVSQSVTTESQYLSIIGKESGRTLGVLMKLGRKDDFI